MACPLCAKACEDQAELNGHLGAAHALYDDEGASTEASLAARALAARAAVEAEARETEPADPPLLGSDAETEFIDGIPASRVYDPRVDDARWRPVAIAAAVLLVAGLVALLGTRAWPDGDTDASVAE